MLISSSSLRPSPSVSAGAGGGSGSGSGSGSGAGGSGSGSGSGSGAGWRSKTVSTIFGAPSSTVTVYPEPSGISVTIGDSGTIQLVNPSGSPWEKTYSPGARFCQVGRPASSGTASSAVSGS